MNGLKMGANTHNGSMKNKIAGVGGVGGIGLAGVYLIFNQLTADLPKMKDLRDVEVRTTAKLIAAEIRFTQRIKEVENNLNDSATELIMESIKHGQKLDDYIDYARQPEFIIGDGLR